MPFFHLLSHFSYNILKLATFILEMLYCFKYFDFAVCIWKVHQLHKQKTIWFFSFYQISLCSEKNSEVLLLKLFSSQLLLKAFKKGMI